MKRQIKVKTIGKEQGLRMILQISSEIHATLSLGNGTKYLPMSLLLAQYSVLGLVNIEKVFVWQ